MPLGTVWTIPGGLEGGSRRVQSVGPGGGCEIHCMKLRIMKPIFCRLTERWKGKNADYWQIFTVGGKPIFFIFCSSTECSKIREISFLASFFYKTQVVVFLYSPLIRKMQSRGCGVMTFLFLDHRSTRKCWLKKSRIIKWFLSLCGIEA